MTEVNIQNFEELFPDIKKSLEEAKFISIDSEFSALYPLKEQSPSLFDTPNERYQKSRKNIQFVVPIQIGLTAFTFNPDTNTYLGKIYNFYVTPATFPFVEKQFMFQSTTLNFLKYYGFNFNKFVHFGIPYINKDQELELRQRFKNDDVTEVQSLFQHVITEILHHHGQQVQKWYATAKIGDTLTLPEISEVCQKNYEISYFLHKSLRRRFKDIWTLIENKEFVIKKVSPDDMKMLNQSRNLEEDLISDILGFGKVFRLLVSLQKPIVAHNAMQDILLLIQCLETSLPNCYKKFKKLTNNLFPKIFDTKTISYEIRNLVPEDKKWKDTSLQSLFEYFKDGTGRHLAINSPGIETDCVDCMGKYHEAGWDSFCSGYIFIRMAYLNVFQKYPKSKKFMCTELIAGLDGCKNRLNVIRGAVSSIKIDGDDPVSTRPPYLVVESTKNMPLNISRVSCILSSFGFVEIRRFPYQNKRALIVVDNFGSARRILNNFKTNSDYRIQQYNFLKHSTAIRMCLLSGMTISGILLLCITSGAIKR
ncbi:pre-piRNA 3'-exonuclease trimmer-like isoform X1 [Diorhabda carinulata]|uniref:pre-piRNA 3'-exonuclease trimmer-like isoform X1 n=1 Tax=Diorhabda carinulata TaxID=1163345 RepID=UPI0025A1AD6C|nr:pre-piRNA 3'-exonuclease trimmer-like isoform X1 [Diorhabda carinulata]